MGPKFLKARASGYSVRCSFLAPVKRDFGFAEKRVLVVSTSRVSKQRVIYLTVL